MSTTNLAAVKKTAKALINQKTLTSIFKKLHEIEKLSLHNDKDCKPDFHVYHNDCESESIGLSVAILNNPAGKELVDYLAEGDRPDDINVASLLASLLTAARIA